MAGHSSAKLICVNRLCVTVRRLENWNIYVVYSVNYFALRNGSWLNGHVGWKVLYITAWNSSSNIINRRAERSMNSERKQALCGKLLRRFLSPWSFIMERYYIYACIRVATQLTNDHNDDKLFLRTSSWTNWPIIGAMIQF